MTLALSTTRPSSGASLGVRPGARVASSEGWVGPLAGTPTSHRPSPARLAVAWTLRFRRAAMELSFAGRASLCVQGLPTSVKNLAWGSGCEQAVHAKTCQEFGAGLAPATDRGSPCDSGALQDQAADWCWTRGAPRRSRSIERRVGRTARRHPHESTTVAVRAGLRLTDEARFQTRPWRRRRRQWLKGSTSGFAVPPG